ncbi:VOC family protein [Bacillus sp. JJ1562]|uniref:VOC family protein n=1 Tax=Bacillus sp. JJ1562 TaxID=3122960 RepID=UPI0030022AC3
MSYHKRSYIEHTAFCVKDILWHIRFFREALGMKVVNMEGSEANPTQVWLQGGLQIISALDFEKSEGQLTHIAIMTEDLESALQEVYNWSVTESHKGRNWVQLPEGLVLELIQAKRNSVEKLLEIDVSYM